MEQCGTASCPFPETLSMKRTLPTILMALVLFGIVPHRAQARDASFASPPLVGRQAWFLDMLKALADADGLADPDKVGAILGVKFDKTVVTTSPSHDEQFAKSFERDEYVPTTATWFTAGPPGFASTGNFRPDGRDGFVAGVDPVARGDAVNFKYFQSRRFGLPEESTLIAFDGLRDDSQASVLFYGIDKFTCLGVKDIQARFPGIHHMEATDASAEGYLYYPPVREDSGTVLSFTAPRGRCVTDASVIDFSAFGKRQARARYKLLHCAHDAATSFCSQHPDASPRDAALRAQFNTHVRQACGNLNAFYDKEPRTNLPPPGPVDYGSVPLGCGFPR
jgi:hypothetical protein